MIPKSTNLKISIVIGNKLLSFIIFPILFLIFSNSTLALNTTSPVHVSAAIGDRHLIIFGYTSPSSRIELTAPGVYDLAISDDTGYFNFDTILPNATPEICLVSRDVDGRPSSPICTPPPPRDDYLTSIGPIFLPPTLNLSSLPNYTLSGLSVPSSNVEILFFTQPKPNPSIIKPAFAATLPRINLNTDDQGRFSLSLPHQPGNYRILSQLALDEFYGPTSFALEYKIHTPHTAFPFISLCFWIISIFSLLILKYLHDGIKN
jgi:hypothetical protein